MNDQRYFGLTPTQFNLAFFVGIGAIALAAFFYFNGVGAVDDIVNGGGDSSQPTQQVRNAYPPAVVQNFMDACMFTGGGQVYCSCTITEI